MRYKVTSLVKVKVVSTVDAEDDWGAVQKIDKLTGEELLSKAGIQIVSAKQVISKVERDICVPESMPT